jgi:hypothetical protein
MGMGFQSISDYNAPPPVQNLISEGKLTSPMFGFKFASSGSELFLGGVNPAYNNAKFTWVPVTEEVCHFLEYVPVCSRLSNGCLTG